MKTPPFASLRPTINTTADACADSFECPNCWGRQQWDNQYQAGQVALSKTPQAANARDGFIRKFMLKYVLGHPRK